MKRKDVISDALRAIVLASAIVFLVSLIFVAISANAQNPEYRCIGPEGQIITKTTPGCPVGWRPL